MTDSANGRLIQVSFGDEPDAKVLRNNSCYHRRYQIDEEAQIVSCTDCKKQLDPFVVLLDYARKERNFLMTLDDRRRKSIQLKESVKNLLAEEKRIKARIGRAKKQDIESAVKEARRVGAEYLRRAHRQVAQAEEQLARAAANIKRSMGER